MRLLEMFRLSAWLRESCVLMVWRHGSKTLSKPLSPLSPRHKPPRRGGRRDGGGHGRMSGNEADLLPFSAPLKRWVESESLDLRLN